MSLFPAVYALLVGTPAVFAIVGSKVYRAIADGVEAPYIVWTSLAAPPENNLSDPPPGDRHAIRIDCYAKTEAEVDSLALLARNTMEARGLVQTLQDLGQDPDTGYWRIIFDVDLFHPRT